MQINQFIIQVSVIFLLGFSLWLGQGVCNTVMSNIDKFGNDSDGKKKIAIRTITNFWIGFAAVIIIVSGIFNLIGKELFIVFLTADLLGLGLKLMSEYIETGFKK